MNSTWATAMVGHGLSSANLDLPVTRCLLCSHVLALTEKIEKYLKIVTCTCLFINYYVVRRDY